MAQVVHALQWRKSTYSGQGTNCIEIAGHAGGVAIRDSKDPDGPTLAFTRRELGGLVNRVKAL